MNGWAIRLIAGALLMVIVAHQTWQSLEIIALGKVTVRLDGSVKALTEQIERIETTDARIRALEKRAWTRGRRG